MKKYNCIVVFDKTKSHILFCKRMSDPYIGKYNFVGGKVENGEDDLSAAYRELQEETGITREDIHLYQFMDIKYYQQKFILEMFVGMLHKDIALREEKNPLVWLDAEKENFADNERFAGDQNIAHIVRVAKMYPFEESVNPNTISIGVDGCRGGWIAAIIENGSLSIERFGTISDLMEKHRNMDSLLIDMAIGLPSNKEESEARPDSLARQLLPGKSSSVFPIPCRQAIEAENETEQKEINKSILGKSLAKQTINIIPKIRELDLFLRENPEFKNSRIKECHPEVCFALLNDGKVLSAKAKLPGQLERVAVLRRYLADYHYDSIVAKADELKCNIDDIQDAVCLAVVANLESQGKTRIIPEKPMKDGENLYMQLVVPEMTP